MVAASKLAIRVVLTTLMFLSVLFASTPSVVFAASYYSSADKGWVCTHGYHTFSDKHLTFGCSNIPYWYANGDFERTSNTVKGTQLKKGLTRWTSADSSISFTKATSSSDARLFFYREALAGTTLAVTRLYNKSGAQMNVTSTIELSSNYKTARIYICESNMAALIDENTKRIATVSHEVGHALGLSHRNTTSTSIMCQFSNRTVNAPKPKDVKSVKHIY